MAYRTRKRRRRDDNGTDDWLMTYADMITLLLCFFAIFLSVSVPKQEQFTKAREKVMERFGTPGEIPQVEPETNPDMNIEVKRDEPIPYKNLPSIVDQFEGKGDFIELNPPVPDGDRLITLDIPSAAFFSSGSAALSDEGKSILASIVQENLTSGDVQDFMITVEGHTDDEPIATAQFPSNWELSTARSAAVVRYFIEQGIAPNRLRASGHADSLPKLPNRDDAGNALPDNQAQNRRVVIRLEKIEKAGTE